MRDENGRSAEIQVSVICAATPAESVPVVRLKSAPEFAPKSALINGDALPGKRTYLPAGKLSERPMILQDIEPLLTNAGQSGLELQPELEPELQMVLQLLINEYGDVDQVLLEDTTLPAQIVQELQQRFLLARFLPGRLQGLAVPSALRIVVTLQTP